MIIEDFIIVVGGMTLGI